MKTYTYEKLKFARLSGKSGIIAAILTVLVMAGLSIADWNQFNYGPLFCLVYILVVGLIFYAFSLWPTIEINDNELFVEFLSTKIRIPWGDVLGVRQLYNLPTKAWLVSARKITLVHNLLGLQFGLKWVPGFLIWENISGRVELLSEIRKKIKASH